MVFLPTLFGIMLLEQADDLGTYTPTMTNYLKAALPILPLAVVVLGIWRCLVVAGRREEAFIRAYMLRELATLEKVDLMTGADFERLIADLLIRDGYKEVRGVGGAGDRGADVLARTPDGRRITIQCKRQARPVPADRVRNLIGAIYGMHAGSVGVLVTSNTLTRQAMDEGCRRVVLVGRDQLAAWMDGQPLRL
jgi:restriction system protein